MTPGNIVHEDIPNIVLDLIERQAVERPDAIAVCCREQQMTFRELDQRASQLAWYLQELAVGPETLVGICVPRSLDMIVGILGILKAGGAYVPLDPAYPKDRLSFILADAQAPLVITHTAFSPLFSDQQARIVCLDAEWMEIEKKPIRRAGKNTLPENLAYVIYTSGSTGKPKGVMITLSNLSHFTRLAGSALDVKNTDIYLQTASIAYALSVRQIMIPLSAGASLVIATEEEMRDPLAMFKLIKTKAITLMDMVPSFWRTCLHRLTELPSEELDDLMDNSLRRIVSIGEALLSDLPREWAERFGHRTHLVNIFGQTETTGVVATYPIPLDAAFKRIEIVPIGKSIPDTRLYLLDSDLTPVLQGELGELCVSNPCLARGYLNRPEMTAEKFIPNPFQDGCSPRLYRTGDMARLREDGSIEFVGRADHQVKIRGQRLELGEVEALLRKHPAVKDCVAMTRGDQSDEKYLAAYIIPMENQIAEAAELRDFVRRQVPDYMVPQVFIFMDAFPRTPNGKLDRLGLPAPESLSAGKATSSQEYEEPRNPVEKAIAQIWKDLLKLDRVGIHDNYFDLGGNSLLAVRMFARIEHELGIRLSYNSLFQATTIEQIARLVANGNGQDEQWPTLVPIQTTGTRSAFFGVHAWEGGVLFWRELVSYLPKDQPFYALQAQGVDGVTPPLNRIPAMAKLYIGEVRKVQPHGPYYLGGYSMGGEIAFEMAQQLTRLGEKVNLLVLFDTRNPERSLRLMVPNEDGSVKLEETASFGQIEKIKRKMGGHFIRLSRLEPGEKWNYVVSDVNKRIQRLVINLQVILFRSLGRRLPDALLLDYLRKNHTEAVANYVPTVYPGQVTLFRASETLSNCPDDSPTGWGPLSGGGLDIYHFDASHELLNARYVREVASRLDECLIRSGAIIKRTE